MESYKLITDPIMQDYVKIFFIIEHHICYMRPRNIYDYNYITLAKIEMIKTILLFSVIVFIYLTEKH